MHYLSIPADDHAPYEICSPTGAVVMTFADLDEAMATISHLNGGLEPEIASKLQDFLDAALDIN